jgi:hypothetical protein
VTVAHTVVSHLSMTQHLTALNYNQKPVHQ